MRSALRKDRLRDEINSAELPLLWPAAPAAPGKAPFAETLATFHEFGQSTRLATTPFHAPDAQPRAVSTFINEFWTALQRQASSLHEVSYRACFKPQLPRFFIERLTKPGEVVYDPFMGRGTTPVEAALLARAPWGNDINPLSLTFTRPRLRPPLLHEVADRLKQIPFDRFDEMPDDLLVFYHPDTLRQICALKKYFLSRRARAPLDRLDDWICMVALNRLTGHSPGFFSVYTLPPNQAVSVKSQRKINERRGQIPPRRQVVDSILKKSKQLLGDCNQEARRALAAVADQSVLLNAAADHTSELPDDSVSLVVCSPPFLNVVQYATDNWLRCWFLGIDANAIKLTVPRKLDHWELAMTAVFRELRRVLKPGGHVAFEVGEIHGGETRLEEHVLPCGSAAGLDPVLILINDQKFTKTANCWGVDNNFRGTNTNRIVLFRKS